MDESKQPLEEDTNPSPPTPSPSPLVLPLVSPRRVHFIEEGFVAYIHMDKASKKHRGVYGSVYDGKPDEFEKDLAAHWHKKRLGYLDNLRKFVDTYTDMLKHPCVGECKGHKCDYVYVAPAVYSCK